MKHRLLKYAVSTLALTIVLSGTVSAMQAVTEIYDGEVKETVNEQEAVSVAAPVISSVKNALDGVQISWKSVSGAEGYRIYRKTDKTEWAEIGTAEMTSYLDKKAKSGEKYTYSVCCIDINGNPVSENSAGMSIVYIKAPAIRKFENTATGTKITWSKSGGASSYTVYVLSDKKWKKLTTVKTTSYIHNNLETGRVYTYTVRCLDSKGKKIGAYDKDGVSNTFIAPTVISSAESVDGGVRIKWKKLKGATGYRIYRKEDGSSKWTEAGTSVSAVYTDKKVKSGKKYTYRVRGLDRDGDLVSAYSSGKSVRYIKAPVITGFGNTATGTKITWSKSDGASSYAVYYLSGKKWKKLTAVKATKYTHNGLKTGKTYTYKIRCLDSKGEKIGAAGAEKSNVFIEPQSITGVSKKKNGNLIKWKAVSAAEGYRVYRQEWGASRVKLGDVKSGASYLDKTAVKNKLYSYSIRCLDKDGDFISSFAQESKYYIGGKLADGVIKVGKKKYCFDKGVLRTGFYTADGAKYYYDSNGNLQKNGIVGSEKEGWYYADKNGKINLNYVNGITYKGKDWIIINGKAEKASTESDKVLFRAAKEVYKATDTSMTKAQKLKACFDYSKKAYRETRPRTPHYMGKDWPILYANDMFIRGAGNCFSYAAAFAYMAKAIGYENVYSCSSGGHGWAEIDGLVYDPEWSKHNKAHTYFGLDYDKVRDPDYKGGIARGLPWMHVKVK